MFRRLKAFHDKTMERYRADQEAQMEDWKKRVLRIHEEALFLFYVETMEPESSPLDFTVRGDLVKGERQEGSGLCLMDGEGNVLAAAVLKSSPEEKEDLRPGLLRHKRNAFLLTLTRIGGEDTAEMEESLLRRYTRNLLMKISLITEDPPPMDLR